MSDTDDTVVDEVIAEFLVEAHEGLDQIDRDLLALEEDPTPETVASIFRALHTIKGTCGFFGFSRLESVSHAAENLLSLVRDRQLAVTGEVVSVLIDTVEAARGMLVAIEKTGGDGEGDHTLLLAELTRLEEEGEPPPPPVPRLGDLLVDKGLVTPADIDQAIQRQKAGDERPLGEILVALGCVSAEAVQQALSSQEERRRVALAESTVRVDVRVLDDLLALVEDLKVLNGRFDALAHGEDRTLAATCQALGRITDELENQVMRTRRQPVGRAWNRVPRVVRALAESVGKQVRVELVGGELELDRSIVEAVTDPVTHLVRNAVDHGIEPPQVRVDRGKPEEGTVWLRAHHDDARIIVEVADDGAGIDVQRVVDKAVERGLVDRPAVERMTDEERMALVLLPGLSTAHEVTNVSGRGVGMDVVTTNVERIGGGIEVASRPGQGTTVRITIPMTASADQDRPAGVEGSPRRGGNAA